MGVPRVARVGSPSAVAPGTPADDRPRSADAAGPTGETLAREASGSEPSPTSADGGKARRRSRRRSTPSPAEPSPAVTEATAIELEAAAEGAASTDADAVVPPAAVDSVDALQPDDEDTRTPVHGRGPSQRPPRPRSIATEGPDVDGGPGLLGTVFIAVVIAVIGFVGWRLVQASRQDAPPAALDPTPTVADDRPAPAAESPPPPAPPTPVPTPFVPPASFGELRDGIEDAEVRVQEQQGLLRVALAEGALEAEVRVDDRRHSLPLDLAVNEGVHRLTVRRGDEVRYLWVSVYRGKTRIVRVP